MRIVLFIFSILAFFLGVAILITAPTSIQEIAAFVVFLISAVFLVGASICDSILHVRKQIGTALKAGIPATINSMPKTMTPDPQINPRAVASPPSRLYFFSDDGVDSGPHTAHEMREFKKVGKIAKDTLVIRQGDADWQPASAFSELG